MNRIDVITRADLMWVIVVIEQLVAEGKLTPSEGHSLEWSLLARPMG